MNQIKKDLKALQDSNKELDVKAEMGYKYKNMYTEDYLEFLQNLCNKYNITFNQSEIDWEWCNYIQNKQFELENTIKQSSEYKVSNDEIIANMTADEKFKIICRVKNIDINEIAYEIIEKIECSDIEDQAVYIGKHEVWDETMDYVIQEKNQLYVDYSKELLLNREEAIEFFKEDIENDLEIEELWVELTQKEKDFLKLAMNVGVKTITVEI